MFSWKGPKSKVPGSTEKTLDILDVSAFILGIIAIYLSIHFCIEWFNYNGQDWITSILVSLVFIGFMNFLFEISLGTFITGWGNIQKLFLVPPDKLKGFKQTQFSKVTIGALGILISLLMLTYSIAAIVGAQYNDLIGKYDKAPTREVILSKDTLEEQKTSLKKEKNALEREQQTLLDKQTLNEGKLPVVDKQRLTDLPGLISSKGKEIEAKDLEIAKSSASKTNEISLNHGSVFSYIGEITKIDAVLLQFMASALPSLFFDIISFTSFGFLLYRKRV